MTMLERIEFQKIKTGIKGLDTLFFGGLQLNNGPSNPGLVIAIKGARGLHKTMLAIQMLHGLTKSLGTKTDKSPRIYSLNKDRDSLQDMLLDYIIASMIETAVVEHQLDDKQWTGNDLGMFLFDARQSNLQQRIDKDRSVSPVFPCDMFSCIDKYICERTVYYNPRTDALHFRRIVSGDDACNLLFPRKYNTIKEFADSVRNDIHPEIIRSNFFSVDIDPDIYKKDIRTESQHAYFAKKDMQRIYDIVLSLKEKSDEKDEQSSKYPCVVIDGFSRIPTDQLSKLSNIGYIIKQLKRISMISILVLDDRMDEMCGDADIIIDMRGRVSEQEDYTYNELRISKSVFQEHTLGWHMYKMRNTGIEVYPSIHKLLHQRFFQINSRGYAGVLDFNYYQYLERLRLVYKYSGDPSLDGDMRTLKKHLHYSEYQKIKARVENESLSRFIDDCDRKEERKSIVEKIIFPSISSDAGDDNNADISDVCNYTYPVTAYIGNPNTYKSFMVNAVTFYNAVRGRDTLVVLLDRDTYFMREYFKCPVGIKNCVRKGKCKDCFSHIFLYPIRMGCISADEFFYNLEERLNCFKNSGRNIRIAMDNLHNIDYCFPFIKSEKLFIPALINFCHERNIQLDVICDKKSSMTQALCVLADNVLCFERSEKDTDSVNLYVEKSVVPSDNKQYHISLKNVKTIFKMSENGESLTIDVGPDDCRPIGSTKNFWRQKYNLISDNKE